MLFDANLKYVMTDRSQISGLYGYIANFKYVAVSDF